jgi:hypothetical protein
MPIEKNGCFIKAAVIIDITVQYKPRVLGHTLLLVWQQVEIRSAKTNVRIVAIGKKDSCGEDDFRSFQTSRLVHDIQIDITLHGNNVVTQTLIVGVKNAPSQTTFDGGKIHSVEQFALDSADESRGQIIFTSDENGRNESLGGVEEGWAIILEGC